MCLCVHLSVVVGEVGLERKHIWKTKGADSPVKRQMVTLTKGILCYYLPIGDYNLIPVLKT